MFFLNDKMEVRKFAEKNGAKTFGNFDPIRFEKKMEKEILKRNASPAFLFLCYKFGPNKKNVHSSAITQCFPLRENNKLNLIVLVSGQLKCFARSIFCS